MRQLRLYMRLAAVQVRSQMQYPVSFWLDMASVAVTMFLFFASIALVIQRFGQVGGWALGEIAFLWGMIEFSFGLMDMIFSGFDPDYFSPFVHRGGFDQLMLRPVGLTLQVLGSAFLLRRLGRMTQGIFILVIALSLAPVAWTPGKVLFIPVMVASQVLFFGGLFVAGSTLTFWTVQPVEAVNILTYGGSEMMSYPMHIYPNWLRNFFTFIIPAVFINYLPALYILDKPNPLGLPTSLLFLSPLAGGLVFTAGMIFWRFGLRHYQSTGT
jgi:ABC-2 type transport system permease protein